MARKVIVGPRAKTVMIIKNGGRKRISRRRRRLHVLRAKREGPVRAQISRRSEPSMIVMMTVMVEATKVVVGAVAVVKTQMVIRKKSTSRRRGSGSSRRRIKRERRKRSLRPTSPEKIS